MFPLVKITSLSDERLNPEIVTSPSEPTTSSPSQLASYTKVSASAVAVTEAESISTWVPTTVGATTSNIKSTEDKSASSTPPNVMEPLEPSASWPKSILVDPEVSVVTSTPSVERRLVLP